MSTPLYPVWWLTLFSGEAVPLQGSAHGSAAASGSVSVSTAPGAPQRDLPAEKREPSGPTAAPSPGVPVWDSTIGLELAQLTHTAIVELFEIDVSALGGGVHFLHHGSNELLGNVVWQGVTYYRYPVQFRGVERAGDGPMPRPKLTLGNVGGLLGALIREFRGLERAQVTRRRTLAKYLDAANFVGGLNENADPTSHYPDEVWHVDRVAARDDVAVELDLASRLDVQGAMLPARQVLHGTCSWRYRGPECGYTGPPVAKADDTPTLEWSLDGCSHTLRGCRLRVWPDGQLPFGGFPGVGVIRNA